MRAAYQLNAEKLDYNHRCGAEEGRGRRDCGAKRARALPASAADERRAPAASPPAPHPPPPIHTQTYTPRPRVLLERDAENAQTVHQQKRKLSQQHDVLAGLKQK